MNDDEIKKRVAEIVNAEVCGRSGGRLVYRPDAVRHPLAWEPWEPMTDVSLLDDLSDYVDFQATKLYPWDKWSVRAKGHGDSWDEHSGRADAIDASLGRAMCVAFISLHDKAKAEDA